MVLKRTKLNDTRRAINVICEVSTAEEGSHCIVSLAIWVWPVGLHYVANNPNTAMLDTSNTSDGILNTVFDVSPKEPSTVDDQLDQLASRAEIGRAHV